MLALTVWNVLDFWTKYGLLAQCSTFLAKPQMRCRLRRDFKMALKLLKGEFAKKMRFISSWIILRRTLKILWSALRLVNGIELTRGKYPFLGTFTFNRNWNSLKKPTITCTVSLIAPQWVLAAAHCLGKKSKINVKSCNVKGTVYYFSWIKSNEFPFCHNLLIRGVNQTICYR